MYVFNHYSFISLSHDTLMPLWMVVQNSTKFSTVIFISLTLLMIWSSAIDHHLVC